MTPEEVLNLVTEGINAGDLDSLMTIYEPITSFSFQPGQLAKSPAGISESFHSFIDMNGKLDLKSKRLLKARDPPLATTELSFSGIGSHGKYDDITAKSKDVLSQQPDGTWRFVIYDLWRTD